MTLLITNLIFVLKYNFLFSLPFAYKNLSFLYSSSEFFSICWTGYCPICESVSKANKVFKMYSIGLLFFNQKQMPEWREGEEGSRSRWREGSGVTRERGEGTRSSGHCRSVGLGRQRWPSCGVPAVSCLGRE